MSTHEINGLLLRWEDLRRQGRPVAVEELCANDPHLREELRRRIQALEELAQSLSLSSAGPVTEADPLDLTFLEPPSETGGIGTLAHYRVLNVLGSGGMGTVFEAEDTLLKRRVALKVMKRRTAAHLQARHRFVREARAMAALQHDHIVSIYQVGQERDVPYLAMQLLEGESLHARLERPEPLPVAEIVRIASEIAEGLAAAHAQGLIHRDIKPSNIWLETPRGRVKILDFGLARPLDEGDQLTPRGLVVGTPPYMAPEQARGGRLDARCDLFGLGAVLYEMLTRRPPFQAPDTMGLLMALTGKDPEPPHRCNPDIPPALSELNLRLLAKEPEARPPTAGAVLADLAAIEAGHPGLGLAAAGEPAGRWGWVGESAVSLGLGQMEERDATAGGRQAQLIVVAGPDQGRRFLLNPGDSLQVGRAHATTHLTDPSVSRVHCDIDWDGRRALLINVSTHGTLVNGTPVAQHELKPGDHIRVGHTELSFLVGTWAEAETRPVAAVPPADF